MATANFPLVVTHITIESPSGVSSFIKDPRPVVTQPNGPSQITYLYSAPPSFSLSSNSDLAYHNTAPTSAPIRSFPPAGSSLAVILDIGPASEENGGGAFMHKTTTLDYIVIVEGELELELDGGEKRVVRKGDVVIQRAPMHSWRNVSKTETARMFCVTVGGEGAVEGKIEVPGAK